MWYTTRETVMRALDVKLPAYMAEEIDRAIESGARGVDSLTHRFFYPLTATKYWPYPNDQGESSILWLDDQELASLSSFVAGGTTIASSDYYLEPQQNGPPYNRVEVNLGTAAVLASGTSTSQRSLALTGVFMGAALEEVSVGALSGAVGSTTTTTVTLNRPADVGHILRVDSERMFVTEKSFVTSAQTVQTPLTASMANVSVVVTDSSVFAKQELLLIDSERMRVVDIAGNTLTVQRAADGSVLAAHSGSTIYWARQLTVTRGYLGTTAATHLDAATVVRQKPPAMIKNLNTAYALAELLGEGTGFTHPLLNDIEKLEDRVRIAHGRNFRHRAV